MHFFQKLIHVFLEKNIPFALFKYPKETPKLIAQYSNDFVINEIDFSKEGFLIHPFLKDKKPSKTPIAFIKPEIFTDDFSTINLKDVPQLTQPKQSFYNETIIDFPSYKNTLQKHIKLLKINTLKKIILSRIEPLPKIKINTIAKKYENLLTNHPQAFCYLFNLPGIGLWLGATPEILLEHQNNIAETVALAGTKIANENWGDKEIEEQSLVGDYIENICKNLNLKIKSKSELETIIAGDIQHLKTTYKIEVEQNNIAVLVKALHPTPAVAGLPKQKAIQHILKTENYNRQYYTGFLGMVQPNKVRLYVNLRCAKVADKNTLAFVGGGITKNSNIKNEWQETKAKSKTIESIL